MPERMRPNEGRELFEISMYIEERSASTLAKFLNQFDQVLLDTCSLMEEGFPAFMENLENAKVYLKKGLKVYIATHCVKELKKHSQEKNDDSKRIDALRALRIVKVARWHGVYKPLKIASRNFTDAALYTYIAENRVHNAILVISQDKGLCQDLKRLNDSISQKGRPLLVYRIRLNGELEVNNGRPNLESQSQGNTLEKLEYQNKKAERYAAKKEREEKAKQSNKRSLLKRIFDSKGALVDDIKNGDKNLSATLPNPRAMVSTKITTIKEQLERLSKLDDSEKTSLNLFNDEVKLKKALADLESAKTTQKSEETLAKPLQNEVKKEQPKAQVQAKAEDVKPQPAIKKEPPKPVEKPKAEAPKQATSTEVKTTQAPTDKPKTVYGFSYRIDEALKDLLTRMGVIVHDSTVPYFAAVHGKLDVNDKDIENAVVGLREGKAVIAGTTFVCTKDRNGFKVQIEEPVKSAPTVVTTALKPAAEEKEEAPKQAVKPKRAPAKKKAEAKPEVEAKAEPKEGKAVKKPTAKKKEEAKPEKTEAPKKAPAKTKKQNADQKVTLDDVKANELKIMANTANPNYPDEKKLRDLEAHAKLLAKLTKEEKAQLKLTSAKITAMKKTLNK